MCEFVLITLFEARLWSSVVSVVELVSIVIFVSDEVAVVDVIAALSDEVWECWVCCRSLVAGVVVGVASTGAAVALSA